MTTTEEKMLLKPVLPSSQPCLAKSFARAIAAAHEMRTALNAFTRTDELARGMGLKKSIESFYKHKGSLLQT